MYDADTRVVVEGTYWSTNILIVAAADLLQRFTVITK